MLSNPVTALRAFAKAMVAQRYAFAFLRGPWWFFVVNPPLQFRVVSMRLKFFFTSADEGIRHLPGGLMGGGSCELRLLLEAYLDYLRLECGLAENTLVAYRRDLELLLAVDVSGSMDAYEQRVQREGYLDALQHETFVAAVQSGSSNS